MTLDACFVKLFMHTTSYVANVPGYEQLRLNFVQRSACHIVKVRPICSAPAAKSFSNI